MKPARARSSRARPPAAIIGSLPAFRFDPGLPCKLNDPEWWFPTSKPSEENREAIRLCNEVCTRREECLDWAITTRQKFGILGGTTAEQRRPTWRGDPMCECGHPLYRHDTEGCVLCDAAWIEDPQHHNRCDRPPDTTGNTPSEHPSG